MTAITIFVLVQALAIGVCYLYEIPERRERLQHFIRLRKDGRLWQNPADACQLVCALQATRGVAGEIAEVGTALGGSARLIAEYARERPIMCTTRLKDFRSQGNKTGNSRKGNTRRISTRSRIT